jgi:hypothetical protein
MQNKNLFNQSISHILEVLIVGTRQLGFDIALIRLHPKLYDILRKENRPLNELIIFGSIAAYMGIPIRIDFDCRNLIEVVYQI